MDIYNGLCLQKPPRRKRRTTTRADSYFREIYSTKKKAITAFIQNKATMEPEIFTKESNNINLLRNQNNNATSDEGDIIEFLENLQSDELKNAYKDIGEILHGRNIPPKAVTKIINYEPSSSQDDFINSTIQIIKNSNGNMVSTEESVDASSNESSEENVQEDPNISKEIHTAFDILRERDSDFNGRSKKQSEITNEKKNALIYLSDSKTKDVSLKSNSDSLGLSIDSNVNSME